jgi:hypothetical protein
LFLVELHNKRIAMLKRSKLTAIAVCGLPLFGNYAASAATVSRESGVVLVNRGSGFVQLAGDAELAPGDQVMVRPGGSAAIIYSSDCIVRVAPGLVSAVQENAPCKIGVLAESVAWQRPQPPAIADGGLNRQSSPDLGFDSADRRSNIGAAVLGAAGVGVGLAIALSDHGEGGNVQIFVSAQTPASP